MWCSKICSVVSYTFIIVLAAIIACIPAVIGMLFLPYVVACFACMVFPVEAVLSFIRDHQLLVSGISFGIFWLWGFFYGLFIFLDGGKL